MTPKLKINQIKNSKDWYLVIKLLTELVKGNTVNSDCFNKKIENIKMNQSKMTNSMAELKKKKKRTCWQDPFRGERDLLQWYLHLL